MRKAGDIVTDLFREQFGPEFMETARSTAGLFSSWKKIAAEVWPSYAVPDTGKKNEDIPAAAVHSQIKDLEKGVLLVEADHPGWIQILQTKQGELLSAVQRRYPELNIRGLAFRLSRAPVPDTATGEYAPQPVKDKPEARESDEYIYWETPRHKAMPRDEEFYTALKGLEESLKKRNCL